MLPDYIDFLIKRFENPNEVRTFEKGRFELIKIGRMIIGRVEHIGMVISGKLRAPYRMKVLTS